MISRKASIRLIKISLILLVSHICCYAGNGEKILFTIKNPLNADRTDEPIVIQKETLQSKGFNAFEKRYFALTTTTNEAIPFQLDDVNNDGSWDELAFLISIRSNEEVTLILQVTNKELQKNFLPRAHAMLGVSRERNDKFTLVTDEERPQNHIAQSLPMLYQFEGPGWENDRIAFRSYFDSRNGKDIFGKLTSEMILDSVGLPGKSYHELADWGMDVLKVGKSLGAGALAIKYDNKLYRLGQTGAAHFKIIADGPVRAILQLNYKGWRIEKETLIITEQITIWGGQNYYTSKVTITGYKEGMQMVTGITTLHLIKEDYKAEFIKTNKHYSYLAVNEAFSENKDLLSMGILVDNVYFSGWKQAPETGNNDDIIKTACIIFNPLQTIEYNFYAGWEKADNRFKTEKHLNKLMAEKAEQLINPLIIKF